MPLPPRAGGRMRSKQVKTSTPSGFIVLWLFVGATADPSLYSRHNGSSSILVYYNDVICFKKQPHK